MPHISSFTTKARIREEILARRLIKSIFLSVLQSHSHLLFFLRCLIQSAGFWELSLSVLVVIKLAFVNLVLILENQAITPVHFLVNDMEVRGLKWILGAQTSRIIFFT